MNTCKQGYQDAIHGRPAMDLSNWNKDARTSYLDGYRQGNRDIAEQNRKTKPRHKAGKD